MTRSRREVYSKSWYTRELKIGYRMVRKNGNQYNRRIRRCKTDEAQSKKYMEIETMS